MTQGEGASERLIADLQQFLRWASTLDEYVTVSDPAVADGLDFTFWADECAKHLGLMNGGIDPRVPVADNL